MAENQRDSGTRLGFRVHPYFVRSRSPGDTWQPLPSELDELARPYRHQLFKHTTPQIRGGRFHLMGIVAGPSGVASVTCRGIVSRNCRHQNTYGQFSPLNWHSIHESWGEQSRKVSGKDTFFIEGLCLIIEYVRLSVRFSTLISYQVMEIDSVTIQTRTLNHTSVSLLK